MIRMPFDLSPRLNGGHGHLRRAGHARSSSRTPAARARPCRTAPTPARPARRPLRARASRARSRFPRRPRAPSTSRSRARIRAITVSGTDTPGTSFARNSALRTETSGQMPATIGNAHVLDATSRKRSSCVDVEHRLRDRVLRARVDLPLEAPQLVRRIDRHRIHADADREARRLRRSRCRRDRGRDSGCSRDSSARSSRCRTPRSRRDTAPSSADRR